MELVSSFKLELKEEVKTYSHKLFQNKAFTAVFYIASAWLYCVW